MSKWALIVNAVVAVAVIVAYTILSIEQVDASALLGLLGGQGISAAIGQLSNTVAPPPPPEPK